MYGYTGQLLFVDLSCGSIRKQSLSLSLAKKFLGGSGLGAKVLYDEMPAHISPFAAQSMLGFVSGALNATGCLMAGRYSVVCKSPLTNQWNESNAGGVFGPVLRQAGFDAVFIKGISAGPVYIYIEDGNAEIRDAANLWGKTIPETEASLAEALNKNFSAAMIGPGGEHLHRSACIISDSHRAAGRGGSGAVMGAKKLKALVVRGSRKVPVFDRPGIVRLGKEVMGWQEAGSKESLIDDFFKWGTNAAYGSDIFRKDAKPNGRINAGILDLTREQSKAVSAIVTDARFRSEYACYACPIGCGTAYGVGKENGEIEPTARPKPGTMGAFGRKLANDDAQCVRMCNDYCDIYGLDTMIVADALAWAMKGYESGKLTGEALDGIDLAWGNAKAIVAMTEKICKSEGVGAILAEGPDYAAVHWGLRPERLIPSGRVDCDLGIEENHDFSPTKSNVMSEAEDVAPENIAKVLSNACGYCHFRDFGLPPVIQLAYLNAATGWGLTKEAFACTGKRISSIVHAFNQRESKRPDACR